MKVLKGKSGITVLFRPMKTKLVDMRYFVLVGAVDESPEEWGYCHALEHMLFSGTHKRTWLQINREWEKYGTDYNASTAHDKTTYEITSMKKHWKESFEILADMFYNCKFPEERWEDVEKQAVLSEIESDLDDQEIVLEEALYSQGIGSRYHSVKGGLDTIKNAKIGDLYSFYEKYYHTNNVYLVIAGDLSEQQVMKVVNKYDRLQTRSPVKREKFNFNFNYKSLTVPNVDSQQEYLQTLKPMSIPRTYRTRIGLELGVDCLSQYLFEELREKKGLVYGAEASLYWDIPGWVFLHCKTATDAERASQTRRALKEALNNFSEQGLSAERINNMKMSEKALTLAEREDVESSSDWLWDVYKEKQVGVDPYTNHLKIIDRLSVESIRGTTRLHTVGKDKFGKLAGSK